MRSANDGSEQFANGADIIRLHSREEVDLKLLYNTIRTELKGNSELEAKLEKFQDAPDILFAVSSILEARNQISEAQLKQRIISAMNSKIATIFLGTTAANDVDYKLKA